VFVAVCARNDAAEAEELAGSLLTFAEPPDAIAAMSDRADTHSRAEDRVWPSRVDHRTTATPADTSEGA
jgi:hypothetical protein